MVWQKGRCGLGVGGGGRYRWSDVSVPIDGVADGKMWAGGRGGGALQVEWCQCPYRWCGRREDEGWGWGGALTGGVACPHRCWCGGAGPSGPAGSAAPPGGRTCSRSEGGCVPHRHTLSLSQQESSSCHSMTRHISVTTPHLSHNTTPQSQHHTSVTTPPLSHNTTPQSQHHTSVTTPHHTSVTTPHLSHNTTPHLSHNTTPQSQHHTSVTTPHLSHNTTPHLSHNTTPQSQHHTSVTAYHITVTTWHITVTTWHITVLTSYGTPLSQHSCHMTQHITITKWHLTMSHDTSLPKHGDHIDVTTWQITPLSQQSSNHCHNIPMSQHETPQHILFVKSWHITLQSNTIEKCVLVCHVSVKHDDKPMQQTTLHTWTHTHREILRYCSLKTHYGVKAFSTCSQYTNYFSLNMAMYSTPPGRHPCHQYAHYFSLNTAMYSTPQADTHATSTHITLAWTRQCIAPPRPTPMPPVRTLL